MSDTTAERWLPVPGSNGMYEVSDLGRVRSWKLWRGTTRPRLLTVRRSKAGYAVVGLRLRERTSPEYVHRLVMETFIGPRPAGMEVCHRDGDRMDAYLTNLRYDTHSANTLDSVAHGTHNNAGRTHCKKGHLFAGSARNCLICARARNRRKSKAYRERRPVDGEDAVTMPITAEARV